MPGGLRTFPPPTTASTSAENTMNTAAPANTAMVPSAASPNTTMVATDNKPTSRLLALPPELRNTIYEVVLISPTEIIIPAPSSPNSATTTTNLFPSEPALLLTSHQIRHEALKIYYLSNRFRFLVPSFDARSYIAWTAAAPKVRSKISAGLRLVENSGDAGTFWPFLLEWLEALYEKRVKTGPSPAGARDGDWRIAGEMVYLVRRCRDAGMGWEVTKGMLEGARRVAAVGDARWGV